MTWKEGSTTLKKEREKKRENQDFPAWPSEPNEIRIYSFDAKRELNQDSYRIKTLMEGFRYRVATGVQKE